MRDLCFEPADFLGLLADSVEHLDNTYQRLPVYRQYGEEDVAYIDRATSLMMKLSGLLLTPMLDRALEAWLERVRTELEALPVGQRNDERARFRFRSAEIAILLVVPDEHQRRQA